MVVAAIEPTMGNSSTFTTRQNFFAPSFEICTQKNTTDPATKYVTVEYCISGPLLTTLIICGIIGNSLNIKALRGYKSRTAAINAFLIILACWDLVLLLSSFFLYNLTVLLSSRTLSKIGYVRAYPPLFVVSHAAHTASIWCVVTLAMERYFALCHPFKHRVKSIFGRIRLTLFFISIASIGAAVPKYFEILIVECRNPESGRLGPRVESSPLRRHPVYSFVYIVLGGLLMHSLTPFVIMVVLAIRVVVEVKRGAVLRGKIAARRASVKSANAISNFEHGGSVRSVRSEQLKRAESLHSRTSFDRSSRRYSSSERNDHILAVVVIVKFLFCHSLPTVLDICERLMGDEKFEGPVLDILVDISNVLVVLNSSINFLVYAWCSARFRKQLLLTMRCRGERREDSIRKSHNSSVHRHSSVSVEGRI